MQLQYSQQASSLGLFGFNPQTTTPSIGGNSSNINSYSPHGHGTIPMEPFGTQHYKPNGQIPTQDNVRD